MSTSPRTLVSAVMVAVFLAAVDQTIVSIALLRISTELGDTRHYAWVFTAYMVATTVCVPIAGTMGDMYGRRPVLLFGLVVFTLGSLFAGSAESMMQLIAFRGVQGIGAGILTSNAFALLGDVYPVEQMARMTGLMSAVYGLAGAVGPVLGGVITDQLSWRWIFWCNVPACVLIAAVLWQRLPKLAAHPEHPVDSVGAALLLATLIPALLALHWLGEGVDFTSWTVVGAVAMALLSGLGFVSVERRALRPIIELRLFHSLPFSVAMASMLTVALAMYAAILYAPLLFQQRMALSATQAGLVTAPLVLALSVTAAIGGRLVGRGMAYYAPAALGVVIAAAGMAALSLLDARSGAGLAALAMAVIGAGLGFTMPTLLLAAQAATTYEYLGVTTALAKFFRAVGGLLGAVLAGAAIRRYQVAGYEQGDAISAMMGWAAGAMLLTLLLTLVLRRTETSRSASPNVSG